MSFTLDMSEYLREGFNGSSASDLRFLLLGNIGCGKTSSGDTILGQLSPSNSDSSRICAQRQGVTEGRSVTIVEAPRWYWVGSNIDDDIKKETERAMTLVAPGPHAVLLLVPVCQFTEVCRCFKINFYFLIQNVDDQLRSPVTIALHQLGQCTVEDYAVGKHSLFNLQIEGRVPAELEKLFGPEVLDHTLVLLTCGDYLMGKSAEVKEN